MLKKIQRLIAATVIIYTILLLTIIGAFIYTQSNIFLKSAELLEKEQRMMIIKDMQNTKVTYLVLSFLFISIAIIISKVLSKLVIALYDVTANSVEGEDQVIAGKCLDVWDKMYEFNVGLARSLTEQMLCV